MDGYEYERKVLFPRWNAEDTEVVAATAARSASDSVTTDKDNTRERLKKELGLEIKNENPIDVELGLVNKLLRNPDNCYPELSPNNEIWDLGRRFRDQRR